VGARLPVRRAGAAYPHVHGRVRHPLQRARAVGVAAELLAEERPRAPAAQNLLYTTPE